MRKCSSHAANCRNGIVSINFQGGSIIVLQAKRVKNVMDQACLCTYAHHVPFMNHTPYRNMHTWITSHSLPDNAPD